MVTFPTQIPDYDFHNRTLFDLFLCSTASFIVLLGNSNHVVVSSSINFLSNLKQDVLFHLIAYDYSYADWNGFHNHLIDVPWENIFKFSISAAASEFCEWVLVGIEKYISHCKYLVKPHLPPWFSATCAVTIVHRNLFFV